MDRNSKIYVAGHNWLVGSAVVRKLRSEGCENLILKTRAQLDLLDKDAVGRFFSEEKPEHVVLCAAKVSGVAQHATQHIDMLYENLEIQNSVIHAAYEHDTKGLLFVASSTIYPNDCPQPIKESSLLTGTFDPLHESYALAKVCGLKLCEKIRKQSGRDFFTLVPNNMYGPGDTVDETRSSVIISLMKRFHQAKLNGDSKVEVWWTGNAMREFMYVDDMADAIYFFLTNPPNASFVNIGTDQEVSIRGLAEIIRGIVGYEWEIVFDATKPEGRLRRKLDTELARSLGWKSSVILNEWLQNTYQYLIKRLS